MRKYLCNLRTYYVNFRATSLKYCYLHVLNFYLDNGVMTTPKRRFLSLTIETVIFSRVKISCFRAKAHLVFHWYLYNKILYALGGNASFMLGPEYL